MAWVNCSRGIKVGEKLMAVVVNSWETLSFGVEASSVKVAAFNKTFRDFISVQQGLFLGFFLACLQAADGILTSIGVNKFGVSVEGNLLLRHLMLQFGHIQTLAVLKVAAIFIIVALTIISKRLPWVTQAMRAISFVYVFAAIIPWTYILFVQPNL